MPKKNGDRHASEICAAALSLRDACQIIDRPDMRNRTIEVMAGIHTGAIIAGVVGNRMPRRAPAPYFICFVLICRYVISRGSAGFNSLMQVMDYFNDPFIEVTTIQAKNHQSCFCWNIMSQE